MNTPAADEPRSFDQLLPYAGEFHFDVVFAWDLLNYLEPLALQTLITRLATFYKQDTLLFAPIFTGKQMPIAPMRFRIAAEDRLRYMPGKQMCSNPQYSRFMLLRNLPGFVERAYLMQNNMQEYVFSSVAVICKHPSGKRTVFKAQSTCNPDSLGILGISHATQDA
ncbi:MAG: hypothetical protein M3294_02110 [Pseudomonadota bacterium]|nr:hypothetical protein [Pseudomonadota bacterium]